MIGMSMELQEMLDRIGVHNTKQLRVLVDWAHQQPIEAPEYKRDLQNWCNDYGIRIPTQWETKREADANFVYDKIPLVGTVGNIPVKDLHQLGFIAQQEGQWNVDGFNSIGWQKLGSGCYSTAFAHADDKDLIVKVCWNGDFTKLWLKFAKLNEGKAGCPKVLGIYRASKGYMVVMERLKADPKHIEEDLGYRLVMSMFEDTRWNEDDSRNKLLSQEKMRYYLQRPSNKFNEERADFSSCLELYTVVAAFISYLPKDLKRFDFHNKNAMFSNNGMAWNKFVITDPLTQ
jgi:hypothetical protein